MVQVPGAAACIDRYPWPGVEGELPAVMLSAVPEQGDIEDGVVRDIETLCWLAGKRPCERAEWLESCLGPGRSPYPWGTELPLYTPGAGPQLACNADRAHPGWDDLAVWRRDPGEVSRVLSLLEPAGARSGCESPSGMRDSVGGVEEWVRCPGLGRWGWCLVGGHAAHARSCFATVVSHSPRWHYALTGGRCCLDLEDVP